MNSTFSVILRNFAALFVHTCTKLNRKSYLTYETVPALLETRSNRKSIE